MKKKADKKAKQEKFATAIRQYECFKFKNLKKCAAFHKLSYTTLLRLYTSGENFKGSGPSLDCLSLEEEERIIENVKYRSKIGCGVSYPQLESLIQEVLLAVTKANPDRITGYEKSGQYPDKSFVRRMVARHNLSLRRTAEISKGIISQIVDIFVSFTLSIRSPGFD